MPVYDTVILTGSMLNPNRYQSFSVADRLRQTIETVQSIKLRIPSSFCLLIEGSVLSPENLELLSSHYDHVIQLGSDPTVAPYVNHPGNIGFGELKLLERGVDYLLQQGITGKRVFKLGARYSLTDKFDISAWDPAKFNFRQHVDVTFGWPVYTTGLYSVPADRLEMFREILQAAQGLLSDRIPEIERVVHMLIPASEVNLLPDIGLQGQLSYNGTYFSI